MDFIKIRALINRRLLKEDTSDLIKRIIRRIIGLLLIPCIVIPIVGFFLMVLGVILIAPDIASFLSRPACNLLWSNRPPPNQPRYSKAEAMLIHGRLAEAEKEYLSILEEFPQEIKAHAALLRIATVESYDPAKAEEHYEQAISSLKKESDQNQITQLYQSYLQNTGRHG